MTRRHIQLVIWAASLSLACLFWAIWFLSPVSYHQLIHSNSFFMLLAVTLLLLSGAGFAAVLVNRSLSQAARAILTLVGIISPGCLGLAALSIALGEPWFLIIAFVAAAIVTHVLGITVALIQGRRQEGR